MIAEWLMGNDVDVAAIAKATASLLHAVNESDVPAVVAVWSGDGRSCLRITAPFAAARRSRPDGLDASAPSTAESLRAE